MIHPGSLVTQRFGGSGGSIIGECNAENVLAALVDSAVVAGLPVAAPLAAEKAGKADKVQSHLRNNFLPGMWQLMVGNRYRPGHPRLLFQEK